jgi:VWFA-related protein
MRCRIGVLLVVFALALPVYIAGQAPATTAPPPQDQTPVFRSGVEAVRFEAIVTDKDGRPITDLTADDFEVSEDGVPQTIEQFTPVVLPAPRPHDARSTAVRSDVSVNADVQDRVYVIVLDRLSWPLAVQTERLVKRFLNDYFADADIAALASLDHGSSSLRFTNDRKLLMEQMAAFVERATHIDLFHGLPNRDAFGPLNSARVTELARDRSVEEKAALFGDIAKSLSHIEARRKSILYVSSGLEIDPYDAVDTPKSTFSENARTMMEPIMAGNLSVYPFYPGGADLPTNLTRESAPDPRSTLRMAGPLTLRTMRALAYVTGGVPTGTDINRAFNQIIHDNSAYYVLGYQSTNPKRDGAFRRLHVTVNRKGAKVRYRTGYFVERAPIKNPEALFSFDGRIVRPPPFVPPTDLSADLTKAMESPVALTAVPMTVFAVAHKAAPQAGSPRSTVTVVVEIPASGLDLTRTTEEVAGQIDLAIGATSGLRTIRGTGFTYDVHVRGQALEQFDARGLRMTAEIPLEPGEYRLGVAAGGRGGRIGKAFYDLTVPDFSQSLLAMSGVSLTSSAARTTVTLQPAHVRPALPDPATVSRVFERADTVVLYTEVYENIWWTDAAHTITLTTELRSSDGTVIPMSTERRASGTPQVKEGGHPFTARIPLADVRPGSYLLHLEARSDFDTPRSVAQDVPIQVR